MTCPLPFVSTLEISPFVFELVELRSHRATRIYGTAFFKQKDLDEHLEHLEQARARDDRKLGRELGLFTFSEVSPGVAFWLPRGTALFTDQLVALNRSMQAERGYEEVKTPLVYDSSLYRDLRPLGQVQGEHLRLGVRGPRVRHQADELPGSLAPLRAAALELPRPAVPLRRAGPAAPPRAVAARCTACCACGTSSRTTPTSSVAEEQVERRGQRLPGLRLRPLERCSDSRCTSGLSTRPDKRLGGDEFWDHAEGDARPALAKPAASTTRSPRATARFTRRRSTSHDRLARALVAARHRAARLQPARALRARLHRAPTTRSTGR